MKCAPDQSGGVEYVHQCFSDAIDIQVQGNRRVASYKGYNHVDPWGLALSRPRRGIVSILELWYAYWADPDAIGGTVGKICLM